MEYNLLDAIVGLILVGSLIIGYIKGFVGALGGILSTLGGLVLAFLYRQPAADYLQEHYGLVSALTSFLEKRLSIPAGASDPSGLGYSLPVVNQGLAVIHNRITEFAQLLVIAGCFLLLYMIGNALIKLLCWVLEKILHRGMLRGINHAGGMVVLLVQNILVMAALTGILASPVAMGAQIGIKGTEPLMAQMQNSVLVPYLLQIFAGLQAFITRLI